MGETLGYLVLNRHNLRIPICQGNPEKGVGLEILANVPMKITHRRRLPCWHLPYTLLDSVINGEKVNFNVKK